MRSGVVLDGPYTSVGAQFLDVLQWKSRARVVALALRYRWLWG